MRITWQQRLAANPEYRDIAIWPFIDPATLRTRQRARFLRNRRIVAQALAGERQADIAKAHQLERSSIAHLMERCLGGDDANDPALTAGLIPYVQVRAIGRRVPLSSLQQPRGARGAFTALLMQLPSIQQALDRAIRASIQRRADGQNLPPKAFHQEFLRLLHEAQWPSDHYPFTEKNQGYESLRRYWHRRRDEWRKPRRRRTRVIRTLTTQLRAYDDIQIDEQLFDAHGRIDLLLDDLHEPLRLGRITLICIVDKASDCRLGFQVCLTKHPTQFDLLALLHQLHAPWQPMTLTTPGLAYVPGACLPTALGFPFTHTGPGIIRFDNAFCHSAHSVRDYLCEQLSTTLELGLIAHPKGRNDVEHAFDLVSDAAQRFASTTGSHPHDPIREARKHRSKPPRVTLRALEEALSVIMTQHNVTPQARLGGRSPLDVLRYHMQSGWLRVLPTGGGHRLNPFIQRKTVPVHWYKHEKRSPHVNFEYARYYGDCLIDAAINHADVIAEYDSRDIRTLAIYTLHGRKLGKALAPQSWQHYPHSITTRRYIHAFSKTQRLSMRDPLGEYFAYLLEHRELPSNALEMLRVYREFTTGTVSLGKKSDSIDTPSETLNPPPLNSTEASRRSIPDWSPSLAKPSRAS